MEIDRGQLSELNDILTDFEKAYDKLRAYIMKYGEIIAMNDISEDIDITRLLIGHDIEMLNEAVINLCKGD